MSHISLREIAMLFLKLGITAFGGPAAHMMMMEEEVVRKRQWLTEQYFLDLMGATNLIPGPNSTEMAIHIGYEKAGWRGMLVAGICFIFPAVIITGCFAFMYKKFGTLPQVQPYIYGIKPAIIAVMIGAVYPLAKKSIKTVELMIIGLAVLVLSLIKVNEIYLLFGAGLIAIVLSTYKKSHTRLKIHYFMFLPQISIYNFMAISNFKLFWIFLKIGSLLYGSGYVLFAFLDTELVSTGIMPRNQLIDAIAVGQFTPGPVFSAVTFIGYQVKGLGGAFFATLGIFLPSFLFVALLNPLVKKVRNSEVLSTFLDAVNVASVAIIISVCFVMGNETINDWRTVLIAILAIILTLGYRKINSAYIILGGSLAGFLLAQVG